jgi:hypothetical protein
MMNDLDNLNNLIYPEFKLEANILQDQDYIDVINSLDNPDTCIKNIHETFRNINKSTRGNDRMKFRTIALFLPFEDKIKAREIAEKYTKDEQILETIELCDKAYQCWQDGKKTGLWINSKIDAIALIDRLDENLFFYHNFFKCYKQINNKLHESIKWFEEIFNDFI